MTRPRSPETQERREWLKQLRKDCNSIYKRLQKLPPNCKTGKKHLLYSYKSAIKQLNERVKNGIKRIEEARNKY